MELVCCRHKSWFLIDQKKIANILENPRQTQTIGLNTIGDTSFVSLGNIYIKYKNNIGLVLQHCSLCTMQGW